MVIPYGPSTASNDLLTQIQVVLVKRHFDKFGVTCDVVSHQSVRTSLVAQGIGPNGKVYDLVVVAGFVANRYFISGNDFFHPESLTLMAYPSRKPIIFLGATNSGAAFTQTAGGGGASPCSTGVGGMWLATQAQDSTHAAWRINGPESWRSHLPRPMVGLGVSKPAGIWRPLIAYGVGSQIANLDQTFCFNCDDFIDRSTAYPDTMLVLMRNLSSLGGTYATCMPMYFVAQGSSSGTSSLEQFVMAAASADSFSSGAIYSNRAKIPQMTALLIKGAFRSADGETQFNTEGLEPASVGDSATSKVELDSLATWSALHRARFTITYEPNVDSLQFYAFHKAWFARLRNIKYVPLVTAGVTTRTFASGNGAASVNQPVDPFGSSRTRVAWGGGLATGADTSSYANALWAIQMGIREFGADLVDRTIVPAGDDMEPSNANTVRDTLYAALALAGVKAILVNAKNTGRALTPTYSTPVVLRSGFTDPTSTTTSPPLVRGTSGRELYVNPTTGLSTIGRYISLDVAQNYNRWCISSLLFGNKELLAYPQVAVGSNSDDDEWCYSCGSHTAGLGYNSAIAAPSHHAFWLFKMTLNTMGAINGLAGRTLVRSAWPSEIAVQQ